MTINSNEEPYDRLQELKQFDDSKIGVKGLVDSGLTTIPRFFHHPPDARPENTPSSLPDSSHLVSVIDLSGPRSEVIDQIRRASSSLGFFQVTNHGVSDETLRRTIAAIKAFNEQPAAAKALYYHREPGRGAAFSTNFDLFQSKAASWRDTLQMRMAPTPPDPDAVPETVRSEVFEWDREIKRLGGDLMGMISEGLGLERERLRELSCLDARAMVAHYYPYCPQPDLTVGIASHTDPGVLTVLQQNDVGGLRVKYGDDWVDVEPVPGALVVNIGDILQIMSNDKYKSVEHQVLANPSREPRVSIAVFFNPSDRDALFGPLPELVSPVSPPVYRQFMLADLFRRFFTKELDGKTLASYYKVKD